MLHTIPVEILCKQLENLSTIKFVEGAVINESNFITQHEIANFG